PVEVALQIIIGLLRNPVGGISICRAAGGWVVLKTAISRRVVRWGDDDAISARVIQDRMRDCRGGRIASVAVHTHFQLIGHKHLERADHCRYRESMGIAANTYRPSYALLRAVVHDGRR